MNRLIDRQHQIPGGFRFYQPETKWQSQPWASFDSIVEALIAHRKGNPAYLEKYGWATDRPNVANEVEAYNVHLCEQFGWTKFISATGGTDPIPKYYPPQQPLSNQSGKLVVGAKSLADWSISGQVVDQEQADSRASVCASCPNNLKADVLSFFTAAAGTLIKKELELRNERKLTTVKDAMLSFCDACGCPLKLKVHCPTEIIRKHMTEEIKNALDKNCWILSELK